CQARVPVSPHGCAADELPSPALDAARARDGVRRSRGDPQPLPTRDRGALPLLLVRRRDVDLVRIRPARGEEVELVAGLIDAATEWVGRLGFEQWPLPFPRDEIAAAIAQGEVYVGEVDGEAVATVTLLADDPAYWGER